MKLLLLKLKYEPDLYGPILYGPGPENPYEPQIPFCDIPVLNGSDYYVVYLSGEERIFINPNINSKGNISLQDNVLSLVNLDKANKLQIISPEGFNFTFRESNDWLSLYAAANGWYFGSFGVNSKVDFSSLTDNHVLHFAYRNSSKEEISVLLHDSSDNTFAIQLEQTPYQEWTEVEIPITDIKNKGLDFSKPIQVGNCLFSLQIGGLESDAIIEFDAIFFYIPLAQ